MRETIEEILELQAQFSAENTPEMQRRGILIRDQFPAELRQMRAALAGALGPYADDANAQGRDATGRKSRIPWVRWFSKRMSRSAQEGWYVVYLFHPDGSGVSLCLSHGSTRFERGVYFGRSDEEVAELQQWGTRIVGEFLADDHSIRAGIKLGNHSLARAYERTTICSKFYAKDAIPSDDELVEDLLAFTTQLKSFYYAQDRGLEPGGVNPEVREARDEVEGLASPLRGRNGGQGRGLSGPARKAVEKCAMALADEWLAAQGFSTKDVSKTHSCDFLAERHGEEWVVEVKGTTGGPNMILLTRNEVALHLERYPKNILLVVHDIRLTDDDAASGGTLTAHDPWKLYEDRLSPLGYEYRLKTTNI